MMKMIILIVMLHGQPAFYATGWEDFKQCTSFAKTYIRNMAFQFRDPWVVADLSAACRIRIIWLTPEEDA